MNNTLLTAAEQDLIGHLFAGKSRSGQTGCDQVAIQAVQKLVIDRDSFDTFWAEARGKDVTLGFRDEQVFWDQFHRIVENGAKDIDQAFAFHLLTNPADLALLAETVENREPEAWHETICEIGRLREEKDTRPVLLNRSKPLLTGTLNQREPKLAAATDETQLTIQEVRANGCTLRLEETLGQRGLVVQLQVDRQVVDQDLMQFTVRASAGNILLSAFIPLLPAHGDRWLVGEMRLDLLTGESVGELVKQLSRQIFEIVPVDHTQLDGEHRQSLERSQHGLVVAEAKRRLADIIRELN